MPHKRVTISSNMWAKSAGVLFVARVVFPGENKGGQPTICSHTEVSRLLHYRLGVIEAALLKLIQIKSGAAASPRI
jgi:hypothetical protein